MEKVYYQTTPLTGPQLDLALAAAQTQNERVLALMELHRKATARQLWHHYQAVYGPAELTSIRRSLTNLAQKNTRLERSQQLHQGEKGKPEHYYVLTPQKPYK